MLLDGKWLNDRIVTAAQNLIKESYPSSRGLQDVSLGLVLGFNVCKTDFIQILHTGKDHWVTLSTIGCEPGHVDVFDSMVPATELTQSMELQIAALLHTDRKEITVTYVTALTL